MISVIRPKLSVQNTRILQYRMVNYLINFANEHNDFREPEVKSIGNLFGFETCFKSPAAQLNPFVIVSLPSEACCHQLCSRSVLIKSIYELWATGDNYEELCKNLRSLPEPLLAEYTREDTSFRIIVESYNYKLTQKDKIAKIEYILANGIDFKSRLDLTKASNSFHLLEYYGPQKTTPPDGPFQTFFGRWVADGRRDYLEAHDLKKRKILGNTTMDPTLSIIMSNMGLVQEGSLVLDPFVGSGGLLVSAASLGAYVLGTDLDYNLLHGRGRSSRHDKKFRKPDEDNIRNLLGQYNLQHHFIDCLVADASQHRLWRRDVVFDAIITDPPYGVREPVKKLGSKNTEPKISFEQLESHIPGRVQYDLSDTLHDLLQFAAEHLRLGGRLVYWLPVYRPEYNDDQVPTHPCLRLLENSEQELNTRISRRLITMEKHSECEESAAGSWRRDVYANGRIREKYFAGRHAHCVPGGKRTDLDLGGEGVDLETVTQDVEQSVHVNEVVKTE